MTRQAEEMGLPPRPFLYTIDQIATMLAATPDVVRSSYLHYDGRDLGARPKDLMAARNIAPVGEPPEWRVAEREFIRWLRVKGFRVYERAWARS